MGNDLNGNAQGAGLLGKGTVHKADHIGLDVSGQSLKQGVDMGFGASGVAPADEVDYFHFALQSTCARRENTV